MKGIDYSWADPKPSPAALRTKGVGFICRYLSNDPAKNLTKAEAGAALAAGIDVVLDWEYGANAMRNGYAQGVADATVAQQQAAALGFPAAPIYFSCDFDATPADQTAINAYLDGVASVIGLDRTGIYGGYWPVSRAFDAGKVTYGWQAYAWSGGNWDSRAQIRQTENGVTVAGVNADWDESMTADFGQVSVSPDPYPTLSEGAAGAAVTALQTRLNDWNANPQLTVDGIFGPDTLTAVKAFQTAHHLTADGIVGAATWAALNATATQAPALRGNNWEGRLRLRRLWGPPEPAPMMPSTPCHSSSRKQECCQPADSAGPSSRSGRRP
jgi:Domain of unknown function (DUF1906)/Putative peptidoglycan binding domain